MLNLACGLEVVLTVKIVAALLGALGLTGAAVAATEGEAPCSDDS